MPVLAVTPGSGVMRQGAESCAREWSRAPGHEVVHQGAESCARERSRAPGSGVVRQGAESCTRARGRAPGSAQAQQRCCCGRPAKVGRYDSARGRRGSGPWPGAAGRSNRATGSQRGAATLQALVTRARRREMSVAIGLVGAGRVASEAYAPALAVCPDVQFACIWARSPEPARSAAERFDAQTYQRFDDLLDRCDGVVFAVPPGIQADLATAAAHRGKAVLLNLPIGEDLARAEQLANAVTALDVVSQLALAWRYTPAVRTFLTVEARRTLPQGGSGRVVSGVLSARHVTSAWRRERGVLHDQGADLVED